MNGILREYSSYFDLALRVLDPLVVILATLLLQSSYADLRYEPLFKSFVLYGAVFTTLLFPVFKTYRSWRGVSLFTEVRAVALGWFSVLLAFNLCIMLLASEAQRAMLWPYGLLQVEVFWAWGGLTLMMLAGLRIGVRMLLRTMRRLGRNSRTAVILGAGDLGQKVAETIQRNIWLGYRILAFLDDDPSLKARRVSGVRVRGTLDDVVRYVNTRNVDIVFVALPLRNEFRIREIMTALNDSAAEVLLVPDLFNFQMLSLNVSELAGLPVVNMNGSRLTSAGSRLLKRIEDFVLASAILVLISPIMIGIAVAVKLTSAGPVLFKQRRYGLKGDSVLIYKFRSMTVCEDGDVITQAGKCDPRVTPLGAFLRRTSLDELPQFINVLQGRMSIVGPRPHAIAHNEMYRKLIDSYMLRHKVKPGITGWAQVNGWRGETDTLEKMEKRVEHDLHYIFNWSLWLDLRIIVMTVFKGFVGKNAY